MSLLVFCNWWFSVLGVLMVCVFECVYSVFGGCTYVFAFEIRTFPVEAYVVCLYIISTGIAKSVVFGTGATNAAPIGHIEYSFGLGWAPDYSCLKIPNSYIHS